MAKINVCNVSVLGNPSLFFKSFQFEITFECFEALPDDLEWKLTYVGSAESESYDQVLDSVLVGPVPEGRHMFVFEADPPDAAKLPQSEVVGVTVILLTCSYRGLQFVKIGYFVSNEYSDPELRENPPSDVQFDKLQRTVVADQPRVTVHAIKWGDEVEQNAEENEATSEKENEAALPSDSPQKSDVKTFMNQPVDRSLGQVMTNGDNRAS